MTDQLKTLKSDYETASDRMSNALLYPETREAVHKALTGESLEANENRLYVVSSYGEVLRSIGSTTTPVEYYLAARREDYNNAFNAYDNALSARLAKTCLRCEEA